jgi:hypothetical protein
MARLSLKGVSQTKRRLVYRIFEIYRECGFLTIYKELFPNEMGRILKLSEFNLQIHLERLEKGEPKWMFNFKRRSVMTEVLETPKKKIIRQLVLFTLALFLSGCFPIFPDQPWIKRMKWENDIFMQYADNPELRDKILAVNYTQPDGTVVFPAGMTPSSGLPVDTFTNSWYYKNSTMLRSTYGTRGRGRCR